jgi:hypothetical protein
MAEWAGPTFARGLNGRQTTGGGCLLRRMDEERMAVSERAAALMRGADSTNGGTPRLAVADR